jgi:hypothetical protein
LIKIKKAVVVMNYLEHTWYLYSCSVPMRGSPAQGFRRLEAVSGRLPASIRVKETGRRSKPESSRNWDHQLKLCKPWFEEGATQEPHG